MENIREQNKIRYEQNLRKLVKPLLSAVLFLLVAVFPFVGYASAVPTPTPTPKPVPQITATPRPTPTPVNQIHNPTPTPSPTSDPMTLDYVREGVERVKIEDVTPTPAKASKNISLKLKDAVEKSIEAAKPSIRLMEISKSNAQKQVVSLRSNVNMAITAMETDNRYKELKDEEDKYGDNMEPMLRFELDMYESMEYEELNNDDRRTLSTVRDLGFDQLNFNLRRIDYNIEITKKSLEYAAYAQYAGIAKMQAALELQEEALAVQKKNLDILEKKYSLGLVAKTEVDSAKISYDKAILELQRSNRSLTILLSSFNKSIGENLGTTYAKLDRSGLVPKNVLGKLNAYLERALQERSEILIAAENKRLAVKETEYYNEDPYRFESLYAKEDADLSAEEASIEYDSTVQTVESGVRSAYKQLQSLRGGIAYYQSQVKSAQNTYDRVQKTYELGMSAQTAVESANMALMQAKMQLENSKIDIWLQEKKMDIICGIGPGNL